MQFVARRGKGLGKIGKSYSHNARTIEVVTKWLQNVMTSEKFYQSLIG